MTHYMTQTKVLLLSCALSISTRSPHTRHRYFSSAVDIHSPPPLNFSSFNGEPDYRRAVAELYTHGSQTAWHTPVEIFKPWYAQAIANYIVRHAPDEEFEIYEIGGGNGVCARGILDYLRQRHIGVYERVSYVSIDISPMMSARQQFLNVVHPQFRTVNASILDWDKPVENPCFVIALEVMDNMAHDKVVRRGGEVLETVVVASRTPEEGFDGLAEITRPLQDPLIGEYLDLLSDLPKESPSVFTLLLPDHGSDIEYVPTHTLRFLKVLRDFFPRHKAILADFDYFPPRETIPGVNAPVVQQTQGGEATAHDSYLSGRGACDIFFPTDFKALQHVYDKVCDRQSKVGKSKAFLEVFADTRRTKTKGTFNPLLHDFKNTSFLTS